MSQTQTKSREFVTKEIFIALTPFLASYMWTIFFEAGYCRYFGIPHEFIRLDLQAVFLTNRFSLIAATVAFLWIGLYYNLMPSFSSITFKSFITLFLAFSIGAGAFYGRYSAMSAKGFYVIDGDSREVVLRIYDDKVISAPFNQQTLKVGRTINVHVLSQKPNLSMTYLPIGPLRVDDVF